MRQWHRPCSLVICLWANMSKNSFLSTRMWSSTQSTRPQREKHCEKGKRRQRGIRRKKAEKRIWWIEHKKLFQCIPPKYKNTRCSDRRKERKKLVTEGEKTIHINMDRTYLQVKNPGDNLNLFKSNVENVLEEMILHFATLSISH